MTIGASAFRPWILAGLAGLAGLAVFHAWTPSGDTPSVRTAVVTIP